jgi:hypothetical protein
MISTSTNSRDLASFLVEYSRLFIGAVHVISRFPENLCDEPSPAGLMNTNDEALATLLADIENWKRRLPPILQFRGSDTPTNAGSYHLSYV